MTRAKYWIWLTNALGYNTPKQKRVFELYENIQNFYEGGEKEWRFCGIFTEKEIQSLKRTSLNTSQTILSRCIELGYSVLTFDSEDYPETLFHIYAPPSVLYVSGELPDFANRLSVAVVGSRNPREYGVKHSYNFAYNLAKAGAVIVSGGALGVDCASHRGALHAQGITVCVLGCGINANYLSENALMRRNITFKGALVSEYPPDTPPKPYYFPARNRIISALSDGVLVIEAGEKSGSLITADFALEQGKELFALMGPADSKWDSGSNKLIKDGCAVPVTEYTDLLQAFSCLYEAEPVSAPYQGTREELASVPVKGKRTASSKEINSREKTASLKEERQSFPEKHKENLNLTETEQTVYQSINSAPVHIDELSVKLNIKIFQLLPILTKLEMLGLITGTRGRCYQLT